MFEQTVDELLLLLLWDQLDQLCRVLDSSKFHVESPGFSSVSQNFVERETSIGTEDGQTRTYPPPPSTIDYDASHAGIILLIEVVHSTARDNDDINQHQPPRT